MGVILFMYRLTLLLAIAVGIDGAVTRAGCGCIFWLDGAHFIENDFFIPLIATGIKGTFC